MKKIILAALAMALVGGIAYSQQDSTKMNNRKMQKEQKEKDKDNNRKSSKKMNKTKTDSVNSNMDSTSR